MSISHEYPLNLYEDIWDKIMIPKRREHWNIKLPSLLTEQGNLALEIALGSLTEEQKLVLKHRYEFHMKLKDLAEELNVEYHRCVRVIATSLKKISSPAYINMIVEGKQKYEELIKGTTPEDVISGNPKFYIADLHNLNSSIRTTLQKGGITYIDQLLAMTYSELLSVYGVGEKYVGPIISEAKRFLLSFKQKGILDKDVLDKTTLIPSFYKHSSSKKKTSEIKANPACYNVFVNLEGTKHSEYMKIKSLDQVLHYGDLRLVTKDELYQAAKWMFARFVKNSGWISVDKQLPPELSPENAGYSTQVRPSVSVAVIRRGGTLAVAWYSYAERDWTTDDEVSSFDDVTHWSFLNDFDVEDQSSVTSDELL